MDADEAWEEERERLREKLDEKYTIETFLGWLATKVSRGLPQGLVLKQCMIAQNVMQEDTDRWARLESGHERSAPVWLTESEARIIVDALRGNKRSTARLLRQSIRDRWEIV